MENLIGMNIKKEHLNNLRLSIDNESVDICVELGFEKDPIHIAYWLIDEWAEDSEVGVSIFKAIQWFYVDKKELLKILGFNLVD